jgi:AAA domain
MDVLTADNDALDAKIVQLDRKGRFLLFSELEAQSSKEWLVHNLLGHGEASAMYGKPGDGKSVLAEDLGLHVAAGWPWHGRAVRRGAVLYIALERRKLVERRAIAFREKHGIRDLPFAIMGGVCDFRDKRIVGTIIQIARQVELATGERLVLIIIDTLSRALCGGDENSSKDMGAIVSATSLLQHGTWAHIMWLHHIPIDGGERLRGHGALLGALDTTISVVKADTIRTATVMKANDSEEGERVAFTLESVGIGQGGDPTTAPVVEPAENLPPPSASSGKLPKAAQIALRALTEALDEQGEPAPASNHMPRGVKVVNVSTWRKQAYRRGISTSEEDRAKQQAFKRASQHLIAAGRVGFWDEWVWTT